VARERASCDPERNGSLYTVARLRTAQIAFLISTIIHVQPFTTFQAYGIPLFEFPPYGPNYHFRQLIGQNTKRAYCQADTLIQELTARFYILTSRLDPVSGMTELSTSFFDDLGREGLTWPIFGIQTPNIDLVLQRSWFQ
jgi:hypothetical protein